MPEFEGVFVGGKPLQNFLEDSERDKKSHEIEFVRKQLEGEKRTKFTVVYASDKLQEDTRKVAKRVRRFTKREIRKEYGIMAKPFQSHAENAIWAIMEKGPINVKQIGVEIENEGKYNTLSAMVATIWTRLGNKHEGAAGILDRQSEAGVYSYFKAKGVDISVEAAIEKYKLTGKSQYQSARLLMKTGDGDTNVSTAKIAVDPAITTIIPKTFGVDIKVSGQIDIVFKIDRG